MSAADSLDRERPAKVLSMFGSNYDGEVLAAARRADALIKDAGLTWPEALQDDPRAPSLPPPWQEPETADEAFDLCLLWHHRLTKWEAGFVTSIAHRSRI